MAKFIFYLSILVLIASCSSTKKAEPDDQLESFLSDFQIKLQGSNDEILKLFASNQSKDVILRAIALLQDKDSIVKVEVLMSEVKKYLEDSYLIVDVPVDLKGEGRPSDRTFFSLQLFRGAGKFHIANMDADRMFQSFWEYRSNVEYTELFEQTVAEVKPYYDRARELQAGYDSVIWYATHANATYFYAVKGNHNLDSLEKGKALGCKMGLIDSKGQVVVPVEYDLIGNPSMTLPEMVEVTNGSKIGFFSLDGVQVVPVTYDWLVPYTKGEANALVKKDSVFGWLGKDYAYHEGFPSLDAERSIQEFQYMATNNLTVGVGHQDLIKIIYPMAPGFPYIARGLVINPSYYVSLGIFSKIERGFLTKKSNGYYQNGNEYVELRVQKPMSISEILSVFITDVKTRFVGGRSEFYNSQKIILVNERKEVISSITTGNRKDFYFKRLDDSLYQYSYGLDEAYSMGFGDPNLPEYNYPDFGYFIFDGKKVTHLNSKRRFSFTEFVKMDSSYLEGDFTSYDITAERVKQTTFLSEKALTFMRDEILASYGLIFSEAEPQERFKYTDWYKPAIQSYDEVYAKASEIDKYNLDFLARILGPYPAKNPS
jgi:hypothetical protein